jgi:protein involved in polysaccharide export with SLBB domain
MLLHKMKKYLITIILLSAILTFAQDENNNNKTNQSMMMGAGAISVTIGGSFIITGTFPALITERVDQFVTRMYNEAKQRVEGKITDIGTLQELQKEYKKYSLRNITLKRSNGEVMKIDLIKFRKTGDFLNDPYLKNDDVLIFKPADLERDFFTVLGAINNPNKFNYVDGDKLSDALELADGINKAYENVDSVEIDRLSYNGETLNKFIVGINSDIALQRGDRIIVLADETQRKDFKVLVLGEVKRPGEIPITKDNTSIKEAILAAGGFRIDASLKRAKLIRGTNIRLLLEKEFGLDLEKQSEFFRDWPNPVLIKYEREKMLRMSNLTEEDTAFFFVDDAIRQMLNEATLDFDSVLDNDSRVGNLKLRDGDVIIIPQKVNTVYVFGQVNSPGNIRYVKGKDYKYYLNRAGGLGELANDGKISVIKAETREWISVDDKDVPIENGDFIYVPKNPARSFNYYVGVVGRYLSIAGSIATVILLLYQFKK